MSKVRHTQLGHTQVRPTQAGEREVNRLERSGGWNVTEEPGVTDASSFPFLKNAPLKYIIQYKLNTQKFDWTHSN